jgi:hypothetical protein
MKIKAIILAAAAALSLGIAGSANAATPAPAAKLAAPAIAFNAKDNGVVQVRFVRHNRFRRFHHRGFRRFGPFRRFRVIYPGYRHGYYRSCRRYYYLGFVRGIRYYRHLYFRLCRHRYY